MDKIWTCQPVDRVPFIPAVYEQKAFLIDDTPSNVSRDPDLLYRAMMAEYKAYEADGLVIGMDVYNLEAEAMGAVVRYYEGDDTSIPGIVPGNHVIHFGDDLSQLKIPNPLTDGRMPVNLEVARRMADLHATTVPVRGAITGPFSMALNIAGPEDVFMGTMLDPDYTKELLRIASDVIIAFGKAYIDAGIWTIMFDSQASPELLSPEMYEEFVLPETQRINRELNAHGDPYCPLVIGGDTTPILDQLMISGTRQVLCDFSGDYAEFRKKTEGGKMSMRRNMNPIRIQKGTPDELAATAETYLKDAQGHNGFILGTAVVPFGTPTENICAVRDATR